LLFVLKWLYFNHTTGTQQTKQLRSSECCLVILYLYSYLFIMKLTENQIKLLVMYSKKAKLDPNFVIKNVEDWVITITEVSQWILGIKVN
jgi:hypothetical protein